MFKRASVGLVLLGTLLVGTGGIASAAPIHGHGLSAVVPVSVPDGQGTPEGARPTVEVRVGNGNPVPVLLDTGSSGLHIFDTAVAYGTWFGSHPHIATRRHHLLRRPPLHRCRGQRGRHRWVDCDQAQRCRSPT
jgi:hypothetical protein